MYNLRKKHRLVFGKCLVYIIIDACKHIIEICSSVITKSTVDIPDANSNSGLPPKCQANWNGCKVDRYHIGGQMVGQMNIYMCGYACICVHVYECDVYIQQLPKKDSARTVLPYYCI